MDTDDDLYVCDSCGWKGTWNDIPGRCIDYYYNWNVEDEVMTINCPRCKNQIYDGGED